VLHVWIAELNVKVVVYLVAGALGVLGLLFAVGAGQGNAVIRIIIAVICFGAAVALSVLAKMKPSETTHVHHTKLDLSGDVSLEQLSCKQCGASLSEKSVNIAAGAVFVNCEHCGTQYQIEEAPKW